MSFVNTQGYVCKKLHKRYKRNWFLVKAKETSGYIEIGKISFRNKFIGKKIRLKVEICEEK